MRVPVAAESSLFYLLTRDIAREQAYLLLSAAPVESHVGAIVVRVFLRVSPVQKAKVRFKDSPNACVTMGLPVGMFEFVCLTCFYLYGAEFLTIACLTGHPAEGRRPAKAGLWSVCDPERWRRLGRLYAGLRNWSLECVGTNKELSGPSV